MSWSNYHSDKGQAQNAGEAKKGEHVNPAIPRCVYANPLLVDCILSAIVHDARERQTTFWFFSRRQGSRQLFNVQSLFRRQS